MFIKIRGKRINTDHIISWHVENGNGPAYYLDINTTGEVPHIKFLIDGKELQAMVKKLDMLLDIMPIEDNTSSSNTKES